MEEEEFGDKEGAEPLADEEEPEEKDEEEDEFEDEEPQEVELIEEHEEYQEPLEEIIQETPSNYPLSSSNEAQIPTLEASIPQAQPTSSQIEPEIETSTETMGADSKIYNESKYETTERDSEEPEYPELLPPQIGIQEEVGFRAPTLSPDFSLIQKNQSQSGVLSSNTGHQSWDREEEIKYQGSLKETGRDRRRF